MEAQTHWEVMYNTVEATCF